MRGRPAHHGPRLDPPFADEIEQHLVFIPGAGGLRRCNTYHGPMRDLVAFRPAGVFSNEQLGQGPAGDSLIAPQ